MARSRNNLPEVKTYVLDKSGNPVPEPDMAKFGAFLASEAKVVEQNTLPDGTFVSTVFVGVDYRLPPRLWETIIVGGIEDGYEERHTSHAAALRGHAAALARAKAGLSRANR
jgi:hypothetical protein